MKTQNPESRIFSFGKIDYYGIHSRRNAVTVEINLYHKEQGDAFTASAMVWNSRHTDCVMGGQCLDSLLEYVHDPLFMEIHRLWKLYHLNDRHAGTPEQETALKEYHEREETRYDCAQDCDYLKSIGLLTVEHNGSPYTYGHGWLFEAIPDQDLAIIKRLIKEGK